MARLQASGLGPLTPPPPPLQLCNMDRVNMSIAILPISQQFQWSSATIGLVQSSFFWGYLLTQVGPGAARPDPPG